MIKKSPISDKSPKIHPTAFIADDAVIIGDVTIGAYANIWFGVKIRGDICKITIGENTSVQENVVIHSEPGTKCTIGSNIIIGHCAMVHGPCEIGDSTMIGISSTVLQGSKVVDGVVIAGGAVFRGDSEKYKLYVGIPAIEKKDYGASRMKIGEQAALNYVKTGQTFKKNGFSQEIPKEFLI